MHGYMVMYPRVVTVGVPWLAALYYDSYMDRLYSILDEVLAWCVLV